MFVIYIERNIQRQKSLKLIFDITVEVPNFFLVFAQVKNKSNSSPGISQVYFFKNESRQKVIQFLFDLGLSEIFKNTFFVQDNSINLPIFLIR